MSNILNIMNKFKEVPIPDGIDPSTYHVPNDIATWDDTVKAITEYWMPGFPTENLSAIREQADQMSFKIRAETSIAAIISIASGISGRSVNISNMGTNTINIIVGPTMSGKDCVRDIIGAAMRIYNYDKKGGASPNKSQEPIGSKYFAFTKVTAARSIHKLINRYKSVCMYLTEVGLENASNTNNSNAAQVKGVELEAWSQSHKHGLLSGKEYANDDDNLPMIPAAALSKVGETTKEPLIKAINDDGDILNGMFGRNDFKNIEGIAAKRNDNRITEFHGIAEDCIMKAMERCLDNQSGGSGEHIPNLLHDYPVEPYMLKIGDQIDREAEKLQYGNKVRSMLLGRLNEKILRTAAALTFLDDPDAEKINHDIYSWCIIYYANSIKKTEELFDETIPQEIVGSVNTMIGVIKRMITDGYKTNGQSPQLGKAGYISLNNLQKIHLKQMNKNHPDKFTAAFEFLVRRQYIIIQSNQVVEDEIPSIRGKVHNNTYYKITKAFKLKSGMDK